MATDTTAQGLAVSTRNAMSSQAGRIPILLGVCGQSVEKGNVQVSEIATYPQAFGSSRTPSETVPIHPAVAATGGYWHYVYDALYDWGYLAKMVQGAIGGMSMVNDAAGVMTFKQAHASQGSPQRAATPGTGDKGYSGTRINPLPDNTGPVWVLTAGPLSYAAFGEGGPISVIAGAGGLSTGSSGYLDSAFKFSATPSLSSGAQFTASQSGTTLTVTAVAAGTINAGDFMYGYASGWGATQDGNQVLAYGTNGTTGTGGTGTYAMSVSNTSGNSTYVTSAADFRFTALGATQADGNLTWTCEQSSSTLKYNSVFTEGTLGFDPLGILDRLHVECGRVRDTQRKLIYIQNGQSDTFQSSTSYSSALQSVANYYLSRGYEVMVGLTNFSPLSGTTTQYNTLQTGWSAAVAALQAGAYGAKVHAGPNLYALMGATGPMGGAGITGAVTGGNLLTVSATSTGVPEVGHIVYNGQTPIGTVASIGTYNGTSGTINLNAGATNTTSRSLVCAGVFLNYDGIHLDGAGSVGPAVSGVNCAGYYVAAAIKGILAQHPVIN